ncbi:hypothetical protein LG943_11020 [Streptomonospora sp. S1-112]|uniref:Methyltransferase domain-containing protein n=1 Tax=Streptomonospora mangrovi TaxID=2883123 RepID=A0A9X3NKV8_9ACTN|nr:hypothetical protein [Streptomonospora mangrovi]MDA0564850.1 hypothetical protein [Streptomonospora mangrovi]
MAPHHDGTTTAAGQRQRPPLAVWPCAQHSGTPPQEELTQRLITDLSAPGDTVVALCHGEGTALAQAAAMGRSVHGIEVQPERVRAAQRRLRERLPAERRREVVHWQADARTAEVLLAPVRGRTRLVLLRLPRAGRHTDAPEATVRGDHFGRLTGAAYARAVQSLIAAAAGLLRAGGHLALICSGHGQVGREADLVTVCAHAAHAAGLAYVQHIIALTTPVSVDATKQAEECGGVPGGKELGAAHAKAVTTLITPCHDDVMLLHKPAAGPAGEAGR